MSFPADQMLSLISTLNLIGSFASPDQRQVLASTQTNGTPWSQVKPLPWPRTNTELPKPTSNLTSMVVIAGDGEVSAPGAFGAGAGVGFGAATIGAGTAAATGVGGGGGGATGAGAAEVVEVLDFTVVLGFRAVLPALFVIFISIYGFNRRQAAHPVAVARSKLRTMRLIPEDRLCQRRRVAEP